MAIKDLFSKQKAQDLKLRGANQKSLDEFRQDVESGEEIDAALVQEMIFNLINHLNKISENLRPNGMIWRLNDSNGMEFGLYHNEYQEEV